jgi:hypothetical protein
MNHNPAENLCKINILQWSKYLTVLPIKKVYMVHQLYRLNKTFAKHGERICKEDQSFFAVLGISFKIHPMLLANTGNVSTCHTERTKTERMRGQADSNDSKKAWPSMYYLRSSRKVMRCILSFSASSRRVWIQPWSLSILRRDCRCRIIPPANPGTPATVSRKIALKKDI